MLQNAMQNAALASSEINTPAQSSTEPTNFQQLFGGMSGAATAPAADTAPAPAPEALFAPKFKTATGFDNIRGISYPLNSTYFADQDTANWVAGKYGTGEVRESDMLGPGPFTTDTKMYEVKLNDGRWVNAGMLAAFYDRNPEALFPGLADKLIRSALNQG